MHDLKVDVACDRCDGTGEVYYFTRIGDCVADALWPEVASKPCPECRPRGRGIVGRIQEAICDALRAEETNGQ